jgi:hypothetical protein
MSKFNTKNSTKTKNKEGHVAYKMTDKERLVSQVLTSFFKEPKYYGDNSDEIVELAQQVAHDHPEFIAKLAVFARKEFNMRSISHVLTAILSKEPNGKKYIRQLIPAVVSRADDMTEILSAYLTMFGKPVPNALRRGINDILRRFDEYAISKYKSEKKSLKMKDLILICHPTPKDNAQAEMWKRCIEGKLQSPDTWEVALSAKGNSKETWEKLIDDNALGYMALLRNLRNIIEAAVSEKHLDKALQKIADKNEVLKSKQLPFRFLSAHNELYQASSKVYDALETALEISVANIPTLSGKTAIIVDVSGSMKSPVSKRSSMCCANIALLLGVMATKICEDSIFITFDTDLYFPKVSAKGSILSQVSSIKVSGGGTDMFLPIGYLIEKKIKVDRILILSDNEVNHQWEGSYSGKTVQTILKEYHEKIYNDCWLHGIDLQGYGTQQFKGEKVNLIAGWSEKVLDFVKLVEEGEKGLVERIEQSQIK